MGFFSDDLFVALGLLIPFAGILVPILVLLLFQVSHPEAPPAREVPPEDVPFRRASAAAAAPVQRKRPAPGADHSILVDSDDLIAFRTRLRETDIFEGLTDAELGYVAAISRRRKVHAGERLAEGGSRGETLFVVLEGDLVLLTHGPQETPVRTAHAGESVPLAVIIEPPVLVTTVEAASDGEVLAIPRKRLLDLFENQPLIGLRVYRAAAKSFEQRYRMTLDRGDATSGGSR